MDSESEDEQDKENDAGYESSDEDDDSVDGELGRLCRDGGRADDPTVEASDSEEEAGELRTLCMAGSMRREREVL